VFLYCKSVVWKKLWLAAAMSNFSSAVKLDIEKYDL